DYQVIFATDGGEVRRNALSDFTNIMRNGKIAMKLDEGDGIVGVFTCMETDDVLLTSAAGQCIRFRVTDVRVFKGRDSIGVRGINLAKDDKVISMSILRHFEASPAERSAYLKQSAQIRRAATGEDAAEDVVVDAEAEEAEGAVELTPERYADMGAAEQFVLAISENGYGKRSSSYEYRVSGRGGKGIIAMTVNDRNGPLIAAFPVEDSDQIMLVTDGGQLIRCPVGGIRMAGRSTQGVIVFNTAEDERVVSVEHISEGEDDEEDDDNGAGESGDTEGGADPEGNPDS
ncbi:MAG: DNA gyrase subunit A, partial [Hyphomicrobiales bacterium]|nr:DNA gyrase subunit A [Hyphomicrobiales bacterium]